MKTCQCRRLKINSLQLNTIPVLRPRERKDHRWAGAIRQIPPAKVFFHESLYVLFLDWKEAFALSASCLARIWRALSHDHSHLQHLHLATFLSEGGRALRSSKVFTATWGIRQGCLMVRSRTGATPLYLDNKLTWLGVTIQPPQMYPPRV